MKGTITPTAAARRLRRSNIVLLLPVCTLDVRSSDGNDRPHTLIEVLRGGPGCYCPRGRDGRFWRDFGGSIRHSAQFGKAISRGAHFSAHRATNPGGFSPRAAA